jgi:Sodium/calcium exchanger protein
MVGLSILAWGNSIGDLFSNIALAKQGYQQMAFAACFGGPMLSRSKTQFDENFGKLIDFHCRFFAWRWTDIYLESFPLPRKSGVCKFLPIVSLQFFKIFHFRLAKAQWDQIVSFS